MWIDTHCHLDAAEFDADRDAVVQRARALGVGMLVIPAVLPAAFAQTIACARRYGFAYALGIHPLYIDRVQRADIEILRSAAQAALADPLFVAIGEIGLDFLPGAPPQPEQEWYYRQQLELARELGLPVLLHVRRSADRLLWHLRRAAVAGGIAHAFNGSAVQAEGMLACGLHLGFGGSSTYDGSLRIRGFARDLPLAGIVLETDAPDIPPQWLRDGRAVIRNEPAELPRIAQGIARLRGIDEQQLAQACSRNALDALPRLAPLITQS